MNLAVIEAPRPATGTGTETNLEDRTSTLRYFIISNSFALVEAAHEAGKYRLFCTTPECIIGKLAGSLHRYGGPVEQSDFLEWATRFVQKEAARYEITGRILEEHSDLIHKAIHDTLWTSAVDLARSDHEDVFAEIVFLIYQRAHSLDRKGTAKLSTRLYGLAEKHVQFYHNRRNANRRKLVQLRKNEICVEFLSDEELASMKADATDDGISSGYAEAGLSLV